jgi:hypothetical protein
MNNEPAPVGVVFFIDDTEFKTEHHHLTVKVLLVDFAKLDPAHALLARRHGNEVIVYKDLEEIIHIENGIRFFSEKIEREIIFFIDKQEFKTNEHHFTVRILLVDFAKEDPTQTTLARREGNTLAKYTNLDEVVHIRNGMKFVVLHNGPTPVS